jgi:hypothetical protein
LFGACVPYSLGVEVVRVLLQDGAEGVPDFDHMVQGFVQVLPTVGVPGQNDVFWDVYRLDDVFHAVSMLVEMS